MVFLFWFALVGVFELVVWVAVTETRAYLARKRRRASLFYRPSDEWNRR